ncbi:MAG TPA: hypothetical protein VE963_17135 [Reyranella sp.]|nr:hypothetical protein [Reyranella sp.]
MAERGNMPTRSTSLFASLDAVLEWLAAVVGFCLFLSINYNITFFFGVRSQWLFFLSATDNLVAALYAIPQAFFAAMLFSCGAMIFGSTGPGMTRRLLLFWLLTAFVIISIVMTPVEERRLPEDLREWAVAGAAIVVALGVVPLALFAILSVFAGLFEEPRQRLLAVGACGLVFLMFGAAITARMDRDLADGRPDVVCTLRDQEPVRGKLVRTLSEGFIVARGDDWIWLPRSQVMKIAEHAD